MRNRTVLFLGKPQPAGGLWVIFSLFVTSDPQLLLLHYKANTDAQDNNGSTPLHLACMYGHEDVS